MYIPFDVWQHQNIIQTWNIEQLLYLANGIEFARFGWPQIKRQHNVFPICLSPTKVHSWIRQMTMQKYKRDFTKAKKV